MDGLTANTIGTGTAALAEVTTAVVRPSAKAPSSAELRMDLFLNINIDLPL